MVPASYPKLGILRMYCTSTSRYLFTPQRMRCWDSSLSLREGNSCH